MNDTQLLNMVVEAIRNTDVKYYKAFNTVLYERPFCYEFYHQFRILKQKNGCVVSGTSDILLSGELGEETGNSLDKIQKNLTGIIQNNKTKNDLKFPDFVIHGGLTDTDKGNQKMVIEVKREQTCSPNNLYVDILKLQKLVDDKLLSFHIGLFIAVGMNKYQLKTKLKDNLTDDFKNKNNVTENSPEELLKKNPEKLYFIMTDEITSEKSHTDKDVSRKYYYTAKELIEDIDK